MAGRDDWIELTGLTTERARFDPSAVELVCDEVLRRRAVLGPLAPTFGLGADDPITDDEWRSALAWCCSVREEDDE